MDSASFLQNLWFILIAVLFTGYLVLEGFDFGVGMLMRIIGKDDAQKRVMINTIGPVWDGNEVWLLTAGGAIFAAFPAWYASMFSGFYLALLLILVALIIRGVAFEYRGKVNSPKWRKLWDWCITIGSWVPAILWGVAFGNIVHGVKLDASHEYVGTFFDLLTPFALLGGIVTCLVCLMHGSVYLSLKTSGVIKERAQKISVPLAIATTVAAAIWVIWMQLAFSNNAWTWAPLILAALCLVGVILTTYIKREGWAFVLSAAAILFTVVLIFGSLYPNVLPSSIDAANSLTITNASSTHMTLVIMSWVAVCLTPIVLAYQAWTYWVFRRRLSTEDIPTESGLPAGKKFTSFLSSASK